MNDPKTLTPELRLLIDIFGPKAAVTDNGEAAFAINKAVKLKIREVLETLPEGQEKLILYKYGFLDGASHTLAETASHLGISPDEARKMEALALRTLRYPSHSIPIKQLALASQLRDISGT